MKFMNIFLVLSLLSSALVTSHAVVTSEVYWNSVLPDTPMPEALTNLLNHGESMEQNSNFVEGIEKGSLMPQFGKDIDKLSSEPSSNAFKSKGFAEPSSKTYVYKGFAEPSSKTYVYKGFAEPSSKTYVYKGFAEPSSKTYVYKGFAEPSSKTYNYKGFAESSSKTYVYKGFAEPSSKTYNHKGFAEPSSKTYVYKGFAEPSSKTYVYKGLNAPSGSFLNYASFKEELKDKSITTLFFLQNDLRQGGEMELILSKNRNPKAKLISQKVADSIPFSSDKLPQIYQQFSIDPDSKEAQTIKETIIQCETMGIEGEEKHCATSLESMIDFTTKKLGKKVKAISTQVNTTKESSSSPQKYTIEEANQLGSNDSVVACHTQNYPLYAVFYCHIMENSRAYSISLADEDGGKVKAMAVCHKDTSNWSPMHISFQVLKVGPGAPVCHVLPEGHVVWVPY